MLVALSGMVTAVMLLESNAAYPMLITGRLVISLVDRLTATR